MLNLGNCLPVEAVQRSVVIEELDLALNVGRSAVPERLAQHLVGDVEIICDLRFRKTVGQGEGLGLGESAKRAIGRGGQCDASGSKGLSPQPAAPSLAALSPWSFRSEELEHGISVGQVQGDVVPTGA